MCDKDVFKDPFLVKYCLGRCKTQEICNKAVDDFLSTLKLFPIFLLQVGRLKNFTMLYSQMIIYSFLMKIW